MNSLTLITSLKALLSQIVTLKVRALTFWGYNLSIKELKHNSRAGSTVPEADLMTTLISAGTHALNLVCSYLTRMGMVSHVLLCLSLTQQQQGEAQLQIIFPFHTTSSERTKSLADPLLKSYMKYMPTKWGSKARKKKVIQETGFKSRRQWCPKPRWQDCSKPRDKSSLGKVMKTPRRKSPENREWKKK